MKSERNNSYAIALPLIILSGITAYSLKHGPQPLIPLIAGELSLLPAEGSLIVASEMAGMVLTLILAIGFSDFFNRKWTIGLSLGAAALINLMIGETSFFPLIVAGRFLQGMVLGSFPALMITYISEEFSPSRASTVIGIYLGSTAAGGLLGRFSSTLLSEYFSWHEIFLIFAALGLVTAILYCLFLPSPSHKILHPHSDSPAKIFSLFRDPRLVLLNFIGFSLMGTFAAIYTYITYDLLDAPWFLTKTELAPLFLLQICGTLSSALTGKLVGRVDHGKLMALGFLAMILGSIITLGLPLCAKYGGLGLFISGLFACHTTAAGWIGRLGVDKAPATSLYMLCYYMGGSALSILGGIFYQEWDWMGIIAMIVLFTVLSMGALTLLLWKYMPRHKETGEIPTAMKLLPGKV